MIETDDNDSPDFSLHGKGNYPLGPVNKVLEPEQHLNRLVAEEVEKDVVEINYDNDDYNNFDLYDSIIDNNTMDVSDMHLVERDNVIDNQVGEESEEGKEEGDNDLSIAEKIVSKRKRIDKVKSVEKDESHECGVSKEKYGYFYQ